MSEGWYVLTIAATIGVFSFAIALLEWFDRDATPAWKIKLLFWLNKRGKR